MSLTLDELESHLYGCADNTRNAVDKTDYKDFILPLVFYNTISDTYQYELEKWAEELGDEDLARDPDLHDFVMPEGYSWEKLRGLNPPRKPTTTSSSARGAQCHQGRQNYPGLVQWRGK